MKQKYPLVSIMIPNYNHSRYLDECIQSALNQTWPNIEIVVLDNQSTDDSVKIVSKYIDQGVRICQNATNLLNRSYIILADHLTSGEFMLLLCADDYIHSSFVQNAVKIMLCNPSVGYVHGERDFVNSDGEITTLDPFFNCSFIAPGENVMPIYMMTSIAHPSQGIFRRSAFEKIGGYIMEIDHGNADKSLWFYLSAVSDYAYIRNKMCYIRVGTETETFISKQNFQHPVLCHLIINDYLRYAERFGYKQVLERKEEALFRLAKEFMGYASGMFEINNYDMAYSYLLYSEIVNRKIKNEQLWKDLMRKCLNRDLKHEHDPESSMENTRKKRNYNPPDGYKCIDMETMS